MEILTSSSNPRVLAARKLHRSRGRASSGSLLVEGTRAVSEAMAAGAVLIELFIQEGAPDTLPDFDWDALGTRITTVSEAVMKTIATTQHPQGVVAVAKSPVIQLEQLPDQLDLVLVLDAIQDPGNAGTLLRTAIAAGASAVIFTSGSVDPTSPKGVRASAGMIFRTPVVADVEPLPTLRLLRDRGLLTVGADARAPRSLFEFDMTTRLALVLGNEAHGLTTEALDELVAIPMEGPAESLNVAAAGAILLFEAARQRRALSSVRATIEGERGVS